MANQPIHVLFTMPFPDELIQKLEAVSPRIKVTRRNPKEEGWGDDLDRYEVLYAVMDLPEPEDMPNLRFVQLHYAGVERVIGHPLLDGEVAVCNSSGIHAVTMSEFAMMLILAFSNHLPRLLDYQRRFEWPRGRWDLFAPPELYGATLGIVGYGSIGRQLARLGKAFGMNVLVVKRDAMTTADNGYVLPDMGDPEGDLPDRIYPPQALASFLGECDFVVLVAPLTSETHHMMNADTLQAMKQSAVLINLARGGLVDTEALVEALRTGVIAGAGLDVYEQEPLSEHSPLWEAPNVIMSPHIAGFTLRYDERATDLFAENLRRYIEGEPLLNRVDKQRGY